MIELILAIISAQTIDIKTDRCAILAHQQDAYVVTYKDKEFTGEFFYNRLCNNQEVQKYVRDIKRWY